VTEHATSDPDPFRRVREIPTSGPPLVVHPEWGEEFPWLAQGCTTRGDPEEPFDLALFGRASEPRAVLDRWDRLLRATGLGRGFHAHQVHGAAVRFHARGEPGLHLALACDGHATADADVLLAVTTADCVPISVVDPGRRAVALLHAGWRGAAAGILERGVAVLSERTASDPGELRVHLGPAICGRCYEVGPEVFTALGLEAPAGPEPLDLRVALARRAVLAGVAPGHVTISEHCTRCGEGFFSHRGGDPWRQVAFLGMHA
jgi:YfiH family protein